MINSRRNKNLKILSNVLKGDSSVLKDDSQVQFFMKERGRPYTDLISGKVIKKNQIDTMNCKTIILRAYDSK